MSTSRMFFPAVPYLIARRTMANHCKMEVLRMCAGKGPHHAETVNTMLDIVLNNKAVTYLLERVTATYVMPKFKEYRDRRDYVYIRAHAITVFDHILATCVGHGYNKKQHKIIAVTDPNLHLRMTLDDSDAKAYGVSIAPEHHLGVQGKLLFTFVNRERDGEFPEKDAFGNLILGNLLEIAMANPESDNADYEQPYCITSHKNHPLFCLCL